jgi:hypothetical protein
MIVAVGIVVLFVSFCSLYVGYSLSAQKGMGNLGFALIGYGLATLGGVLTFRGITSDASLVIIFAIFFFPFIYYILSRDYFIAALTAVAGISVGMLVHRLACMLYKRRIKHQ